MKLVTDVDAAASKRTSDLLKNAQTDQVPIIMTTTMITVSCYEFTNWKLPQEQRTYNTELFWLLFYHLEQQ
jgi:hypothetical protein